MTCSQSDLTRLPDVALLSTVQSLAARERCATADLIAALAELDARRLYLGQGCSSLFSYCTQVLHLSEHAAYGRIEAARVARRFPVVLEMLGEGAVTLTTICLLAPHLTAENHRERLEAARYKSKREVEEAIAAIRPRPPVDSVVRKLPNPSAAVISRDAVSSPATSATESRNAQIPLREAPSTPPGRAVVAPLSPERYKIQFTGSRETYEKLRRAQDLLRHVIPNGDVGEIVARALALLVADLECRKYAQTARPRTASRLSRRPRHIPAAVRRIVWTRDEGRCAFVGGLGRCTERAFLEFHHVKPVADGGQARSDNIELRCRAHNQYEADQHFWAEANA